MASALYSDVKRKEAASAFVRPHEGLFGLREWLRCSATSKARRSCCQPCLNRALR